jgi:hypothetical protein
MISSKPAFPAATATSTLYFQTRLSYGFVHPRPELVVQTPPSGRRIAMPGLAAESLGSSNTTTRPMR